MAVMTSCRTFTCYVIYEVDEYYYSVLCNARVWMATRDMTPSARHGKSARCSAARARKNFAAGVVSIYCILGLSPPITHKAKTNTWLTALLHPPDTSTNTTAK